MSVKESGKHKKSDPATRGVNMGYEGPLYGQTWGVPFSTLRLEGQDLNEYWRGKIGPSELLRRLGKHLADDSYNH